MKDTNYYLLGRLLFECFSPLPSVYTITTFHQNGGPNISSEIVLQGCKLS